MSSAQTHWSDWQKFQEFLAGCRRVLRSAQKGLGPGTRSPRTDSAECRCTISVFLEPKLTSGTFAESLAALFARESPSGGAHPLHRQLLAWALVVAAIVLRNAWLVPAALLVHYALVWFRAFLCGA